MTHSHNSPVHKVEIDRAAGVLLAQACGDALGVHYEGGRGPRGRAEMIGGGYGPYAPAEWSDDTQMALCIATVTATGADLQTGQALDDVAAAFEEWNRSAATDRGILTGAVLDAARHRRGSAAERLRAAALAEHERTGRTAGNGALMRTAVVGLTHLRDREATAEAARAVAELTHADPLAVDSCVLWSEAVRVAVTEHRRDVRAGLDLLPPQRRAAWAGWIAESEDPDATPRLRSNGFTVTALQAAWHAIHTTPDPPDDPPNGSFPCLHLQDALQGAVHIGGDTDTVAAIAGGLLGAYWGASAVPFEWRRDVHGLASTRGRRLRARDLIRLGVLTARGGHGDSRGWPDEPVVDYRDKGFLGALARDPHDDRVFLGGVDTVRHLPDGVDAVVSLCRLGTTEVPAVGIDPRNHIEVRLVDNEHAAANPNLDFVLHDTARAIAALRSPHEDRTVLVHCVQARSRTPAVAAAHAVLNKGIPVERAIDDVAAALHGARPNEAFEASLKRLDGTAPRS